MPKKPSKIFFKSRPMKKVVLAAFGGVRRLSDVWRYSSVPVMVRENNPEHLAWTGIYAALIHMEISGDPHYLGAILMKALTHDAFEAVTGDVVRVFKYTTPELKKEIDRAEKILANKELDPEIIKLVELGNTNGGKHQNYVNEIVKAADFMSLVAFMIRERQVNKIRIRKYYQRMLEDLEMMYLENYTTPKINDLYKELLEFARVSWREEK